jgi:hypothetical protein
MTSSRASRKAYPSFDSLFPSLSGTVGIGQPKNPIRTGVTLSHPYRDCFPLFPKPWSPGRLAPLCF